MTLAIQLPEELDRFVRERIAKLGYRDASEYISALVEAEKRRDLRNELEQSLADALNEPSSPLTDDDFEFVRREGTATLRHRRQK